MILTYKIRHSRNFTHELKLAKKIANFAIKTKSRSSADVKHIGLKSAISNQILKKYSSSKTAKQVKSVKLTVPSQSIKIRDGQVCIPCLKLQLPIYFPDNFRKINQVEVGGMFAYISVSYDEPTPITPESVYGVDRNTTGHCLVAANPTTGKVLKLGKAAHHIHQKYKHTRKNLQKQGKYGLVKRIKNRESRVVRNLNHHISKKLVGECIKQKAGIVLEGLKDIRKTAKSRKKQRYSLNSWSFYQLRQMVEYKAKKQGIPVFYIEPQYTSQRCSRCGHIEQANRKGKLFQCKSCGKVENADVNAGFNIAFAYQNGISRFVKDRDLAKGSTDTPGEALA
ncbi:MAG: transposase [Epsilonproteobacteria bacterium]|nr:MAG: transposase [Campylobacterota bacterium]